MHEATLSHGEVDYLKRFLLEVDESLHDLHGIDLAKTIHSDVHDGSLVYTGDVYIRLPDIQNDPQYTMLWNLGRNALCRFSLFRKGNKLYSAQSFSIGSQVNDERSVDALLEEYSLGEVYDLLEIDIGDEWKLKVPSLSGPMYHTEECMAIAERLCGFLNSSLGRKKFHYVHFFSSQTAKDEKEYFTNSYDGSRICYSRRFDPDDGFLIRNLKSVSEFFYKEGEDRLVNMG